MKPEMKIVVEIYNRPEPCILLAVRPAGVIEVERLHDGRCFRVAGLSA